MGISIPVADNELYNVFESLGCWDRLDIFDYRFASRHTETNEDMIIYKDNKGNFYHRKNKSNENLVICKTY
ncbi:TPA: hypothetical protein UL242_002552 [Clostridioides difficile]|nr:hypothetical protein [Clostridioides difficile]HEL2860443.1 hypothetical protein [Clostridioides difficile]